MDSTTFFVIKGVCALTACVLLIIHMGISWQLITQWGQRLRYITLFAFAANVTYASVDQTTNDLVVRGPYATALACIILLVVTMVVSIREDRHKTRPTDAEARNDRRTYRR